MNMVYRAKKELERLKNHSPKRLLPPKNTTLQTSPSYIVSSPIREVVLGADLRCIKCQDKVAATVSTQIDELESIVVNVAEKKVIISGKTINN